jgi:hypothetical protein
MSPRRAELALLGARAAAVSHYAEFRPVFSAFDEDTTRRYTKITEQFMRGSVQLQQAFEDVVHEEMRVLGRPPRPGASQS